MSNSIWKTPDQKPEEDKLIFAQHDRRRDGNIDYFIWDIHEFIDAIRKDSIRWCYIDDLIAQADKAERLQKQLDSLKKYSDSLRHRVEKMLKKNKTLKNTAADYFMKSIELGIELEKTKSNN